MKKNYTYCYQREWKLKNKKLYLLIGLAIAIACVILTVDLIAKHFIFKIIPQKGDAVEFLPGFINLVHVENKGALWGVMSDSTIFLIILSIIILALYITFYVLKVIRLIEKVSITLTISVGLLVGGSIGNLIDRLFLGYVRDFFNFQFMNFPVFNIADIALCLSIVLLLIYFLFVYSKEEDTKQIKGINQKNAKNIKKNDKNEEINFKNEESFNNKGVEKNENLKAGDDNEG